ncbi:MMPL family transporter [Nocardioides campestrisoli]|uniref:MMPL family transporter n=1 Tax=Nocardioides campestrisoli TaxID=2736757 RepID=UPI0015E7CBE6|nr:MMPL family transporter [Nocardioides campestrisoli]
MRRLALWCQRWRYAVVGGWLALVVSLTALAGVLGGDVSDDFDLPGSESHRAAELMRAGGFEFRTGSQVQLVFRTEDDGAEADFVTRVERLRDEVSEAIPQARVVSPYSPEGAQQLSPDGSVGYVSLELPSLPAEDLAEVQERLAEVRDRQDALDVEIGGLAVEQESESGPPSELVGILAAVVVLLFAFGSVFAMALPILVGVMGALSGVALAGLGARWVETPSFAAPIAAMIAIGVGIDYALLVVTRYRESLRAGQAPVDAVVTAQSTAGRSVLFAGITVVIASLGLVLMDLKLITAVALGIAGAVLITMLAAMTLLPALLAILGRRVDRFSVHRRGSGREEGRLARRWSRQVQRRPLLWAMVSVVLLAVMAAPAIDMRLGFSDAGTRPESDTARQAHDLMAEGFGPGASGPLVLAARAPEGDAAQVLERLRERVAQTPGVADVQGPVTDESGEVGLLQVIASTGPSDERTTDLVHRLRDEVVPAGVDDAPETEVALGGSTAAAVDFADYVSDRLPLFLGVVLGLAMLLLMALFRGVAVALKAVLANLLSIGAALGATVAVFQWGWGVELLDLGAGAPVEAWMPMMLIAIVFGLSMDYEVFLLSRIREEYVRSGDNAGAVAEGLARTARVITAAAAIMICVFGSFVLGSSRELQLFGFGLAFAVLVDATLVRLVLVPSLMELLGDRNWWLPRWLDRLLPELHVEGRPDPVDQARRPEKVGVAS